MKKLNVVSSGFGFEHAFDRLLKLLKPQGKCTVENKIKSATMHSKHGFRVEVGVVFGAPTETEEDVIKTYEKLWICLIRA